jgi:helix-turn-helix protein
MDSYTDGGPGGRLHIHGIEEMPAGYDAEVAELFRDLRSASGLSEADLAAQLATRPEVVQALEQGALYALPPWPETYRVVATYGTLLNLDVRPLLRRIYAQVEAGIVGLAPKAMPDVPFMAPPESVEREFQGQAPVSAPPVEPAPMQPRQPARPRPGATQAASKRQAPARQAQAPQQRPQPQPQLQSHPQHQSPPQPPPQPRGMPPAAPPRGAPPLPRSTSTPQREARAPSPPQQPRSRTAPPPRTAPLEEKQWKAPPWKALVKWGVVILVILGIAAGLWLWLTKPGLLGSSGPSQGQPGAKSSNKGAPPVDPNDPRSRKADRLPGPS